MEVPQMPPQPPPGLPIVMPHSENRDAEHLKILSICYYVMAGLNMLLACFFLLYIVMGSVVISSASTNASSSMPKHESAFLMGGVFIIFGLLGSLCVLAVGVLNFVTARRLVSRRSRILCMVTAGINCLNVPFGTTLGVFTFILLSRSSVVASFAQNDQK